ncbi:MAG: eukaryotic-like serine/threonine-protein kinase [Acidobacteriota bacterium]|nr:eukaryotic-like serine/threonine-protein kinase [Acidobacteriota bacterium]
MTLTPGTLLDHYEIRSPLGEGGMGAAYEAEDLRLRRTVVVKVLHPEDDAGREAERLLLAEARRAAAVNHPNVATVYGVGQAGGLAYIVMERVEGETLARRIAREQIDLRQALDIATASAEALAAAHARAVVHCDIKSSNIMLAPDASVKVLDFGLARLARQTERAPEGATEVVSVSSPPVGARQSSPQPNGAGTHGGTFHYMSPEQLRGEPLDARTDIFSLGVVLYEMVTGRKPFAGASRADSLRSTLGEEPPPLGAYRDDVPLELEAIVRRALAKDREERYQTAREMCEDLRRLRARLDPFEVRGAAFDGHAAEATPLASSGAARSAWRRIGRAVSIVSGQKLQSQSQVSLTDVAFRGLLPFQEADRERFYGRETETLALLRTVARHDFRFGVLFGESGCGKTSLLKAGLVPKLWEEGFVPIYCRSYTDPLAALLLECRKRSHLEIGEGEPPLDYLRRAASELDGTLVVICDQFEEFFINFRAAAEREPFVSFVAACYRDASLPVKFLLSIRGDFLHLISTEFEGRIPDPLTSARLSRLRNFDEEAAAAVIERCARAARLPFEEGLSRRVARDLSEGGAVLPSELQIVGERLQSRRIFTVQDYRRAGGREQLVHQFLEDVIASSGERESAQLVLRSLISEENTRLTLATPEIARRTQRSRASVERTLKLFVAARLLREIQDEEPWRYELVHEYLVEKINRVTGRVMDATQRANRLLRQYLSDYAADAHARIPLGKLLFIRRYADTGQTERGRELFRKSLRRGLLRACVLALVLVISTTLAAAALSVTDEWDGARLSDGHTAAARQVAFSPDGRRLISVGEDAHVIVWDFASRKRLATLTDHVGAVTTVAYSSDGKWFATGGADKTAIVWDAATFAKVATLRGEHRDAVRAAAFTPDGKYLATTSCDPDARTVLWSVGRWEKVRELAFGVCWGTLPFTPDSRYVVDHLMGMWDLETGRNVAPPSPDWEGNWVSVSPDGTLAVAATPGGNVRFFDLKRRKQLDNPHVHRDHGRAVAFSPDGRYVATGAEKIVLWDAKTREQITPLEYPSSVWNLAFSPDGRYLVSTHGDGAILVWNVNTRERVANFNEHVAAVESVAFSRDGRRVASASADGSVIVWDAASGRKENVFPDYKNSVNAVAFSPDGVWLATGDQDADIRLLDLARGTSQKIGDGNYCAAISPDERWVASSTSVIDLATGHALGYTQLNPEANAGCYGVDFSPDGHLLACASSDWERLLVWDAESWRLLGDVRAGGTNFKSVRFSPDGRLLVTGDVQGAVRLWEASPLREIALIGRHAARVNAVAFSSDGREVASASDDQTVALWDVSSRRLVAHVGTHTAPIRSVAFSPDGKRIVTGGEDKSVRIYTRRRTLWGYSLD